MVVGGSIAIVGGIIVCATGAGALAGAVTIYIGLMTVVQGFGKLNQSSESQLGLDIHLFINQADSFRSHRKAIFIKNRRDCINMVSMSILK